MTRDSLMLTIPLRMKPEATVENALGAARAILHKSHATDVSVSAAEYADDSSVENEAIWNVTLVGGKSGIAVFALFWAACVKD